MITVTYDFTYLDQIVKNLETIPIRKILRQVMGEARKFVTNEYKAQADANNTDFKAFVRTQANSAVLTVKGTDVGFLEFGAGVGTAPDEFAEQVEYFVYDGSYSDAHNGMYKRTGYRFWIYGVAGESKQKYTGITATHGMQQTLDELRQYGMDYIRERIASWIVNGK